MSVTRHGQSTILFERSLAPSRQDIDAVPYGFIINLATLPPDTEQLLLTTDNGVIDWRECGFVDEQMFAGFANVPLKLLVADGYSVPAWADKILLLQSPVRLDFMVPSGHHRLIFHYGFNPSLFSEAHAFSDGIGFKAELITATGTHELLNRLLEPYSRAVDRELQTASLDLNLSEPGRLQLNVNSRSGQQCRLGLGHLQRFPTRNDQSLSDCPVLKSAHVARSIGEAPDQIGAQSRTVKII